MPRARRARPRSRRRRPLSGLAPRCPSPHDCPTRDHGRPNVAQLAVALPRSAWRHARPSSDGCRVAVSRPCALETRARALPRREMREVVADDRGDPMIWLIIVLLLVVLAVFGGSSVSSLLLALLLVALVV